VTGRFSTDALSNGVTVRLGWPIGGTLARAVLLLVVLLVTLEILARTDLAVGHLLAPSFGTLVRHLDLQLARLARFAASGPLDCVAIGSSTAYLGIDPAALADGYARESGTGLRCFSLGVVGITVADVAALARILAEDFRPRLLLFATTAGDFRMTDGGRVAGRIAGSSWARQRLGDPSAEGFLIAHSALYRYVLTYRSWPAPVTWEYLVSLERHPAGTGFWPADVTTPVDGSISRKMPRLYPVPRLELSGLVRLADLRARDVDVALAEVPVHPTAVDLYEHGREDLLAFRDQVAEFADRHGIPFWRDPPVDLVPAGGWFDRAHLNGRGAHAFSGWLGGRLAAAARAGTLPRLPR
jgi:hypothetical protein